MRRHWNGSRVSSGQAARRPPPVVDSSPLCVEPGTFVLPVVGRSPRLVGSSPAGVPRRCIGRALAVLPPLFAATHTHVAASAFFSHLTPSHPRPATPSSTSQFADPLFSSSLITFHSCLPFRTPSLFSGPLRSFGHPCFPLYFLPNIHSFDQLGLDGYHS